MFFYRSCGLTISSEFVIPELDSLEDFVSSPDISFRIARRKFGLSSVTFSDLASPPTCVVLEWFGCSFRISNGNEIEVWEEDPRSRDFTRAVLLGFAFAALLYQRRNWPMHVSAVADHDHVWLFCGQSGAGKSTLAALLDAQYGFEHVCDDLGVIESVSGHYRFSGVSRAARLTPDSMSHLGNVSALISREENQLPSVDEKIRIRLPSVESPDWRQVKGVVLLSDELVGTVPAVERVHGIRAMQVVRHALYRPLRGAFFTNSVDTLSFCAKFSGVAPVYEYRRIRDFSQQGVQIAPLLGLLRS